MAPPIWRSWSSSTGALSPSSARPGRSDGTRRCADGPDAMTFASTLRALDLLDSAHASGARVAQALHDAGIETVETSTVTGPGGPTDFLRITVPGSAGRSRGGSAPTLGIIGILGGIGARPHVVGM